MNENEAYQYYHGYERCPHCEERIPAIMRQVRTETIESILNDIPLSGDARQYLYMEEVRASLRKKYLNL